MLLIPSAKFLWRTDSLMNIHLYLHETPRLTTEEPRKFLHVINIQIIGLDVVSSFTSAYVFIWSKVFTETELKFPPSFDGRVILYPSFNNLKDYFSWRQVDCHINNLYNTTFWALVLIGKLTNEEAHNKLKGTFSKDKNEILHKQFEINYNCVESVYKRGTIIFRLKGEDKHKKHKMVKIKNEITIDIDIDLQINKIENIKLEEPNEGIPKENSKTKESLISLTDNLLLKDENYFPLLKLYFDQNIFICHEDVIQDEFWNKYNLNNY